MSLDRRAFLGSGAAFGAFGLAGMPAPGLSAAPASDWERLVEAARARARRPYEAGQTVAPALRVGHAIFVGDAFRAAGDPGCFGVSAAIWAIGLDADGTAKRPAFHKVWIDASAGEPVVYALLDSPSLVGAARLRLAADARLMDVEARLFFREAVDRLAVAPCSALVQPMSVTGAGIREADRLVVTAGGRDVSRALNQPAGPALSRFPAGNLRSFGLSLDADAAPPGARTPSLLITPASDWGDGAIHLAEAPAVDEFRDNVSVAFVPRRTFARGDAFAYRYRLRWTADPADLGFPPRIA